MGQFTIVLIIGGVLVLFGIIITLANLKNWKRRQRIIKTPTSPISQAPGNALVEVKGRIVPGEQGLVMAPFSGRQCVWVRVVVEELRSSGRNSYWATVCNETDGRPFYVDDGSGQMARIHPQNANIILDRQGIGSSGTFNDPPPHLQGFLASRGLSSTTWLGFNKSMRYEEEVLAANDPLYALGPSVRNAGPPVQDGYRNSPGTQLEMYVMPGPEGELILTNKSEDQLISKLFWGFAIGLGFAGIGVMTGVMGAALVIYDNVF